jgi:hypothetical protein
MRRFDQNVGVRPDVDLERSFPHSKVLTSGIQYSFQIITLKDDPETLEALKDAGRSRPLGSSRAKGMSSIAPVLIFALVGLIRRLWMRRSLLDRF